VAPDEETGVSATPSQPEQAPGRGPIFLIGAMGSGTTLLRLMLDSHPRIAIPHETGFMRAASAHRFIPFKWTGRRWYRRLGWEDEEFNEELSGFYDRLFMRYAERNGKVRWGEKTPSHTWHIDQMARLFPDAVFVGLVRHPGGSVGSNMNRWRHELGRAAHHYRRYTSEIARQLTRKRKRFVLLRYEDLVAQPERVMRELLEWLGEPWADEVLQHHDIQSGREHKRVEGKVQVGDAIDASRISKWTKTIDAIPHGRSELERLTGRIGRLLGYRADDPLALDPVHAEDRLLIHGRDLAARAEQIPELNLDKQGAIPLNERLYHPGELRIALVRPPSRSKVPGRMHRIARPIVVRLPRKARRKIRRSARFRPPVEIDPDLEGEP
jgi:hypothetical protein